MAVISKKEEGIFLLLFNRSGYVLDFSNNEFDVFTSSSIGEAIQTKYGLSKGKSLVAYLNEANDADRNDSWWGSASRYNDNYARIYQQCKAIVDRLDGSTVAITQTAENLKSKFSSDYLSRQIDLMVQMQTSDPTNAIGLAKELIESCCKTILDDKGIAYSKNDDVPQLADKTMNALSLLPANVQSTDRGADAIKAVLGNLRAIPTKLAEIRNPFGSGHGKSASFEGLEVRHAKLAVGSSITFVDFIWSTYEASKK